MLRVAVIVSVVIVAPVLAADPPGTAASRQAMTTCDAAQDAASDAAAEALAEQGLAQAEQAVAANDDDALAHFAVFCNLGERMRRRGVSVRSALDLRRLRRAIDRTLALAPDFPGALAGKGALLLDTPTLLGGDAAEAERLLRRAIAVAPRYLRPRFDLVRALERRGARDEARAQAAEALAIATEAGDAEDRATARALVRELES